MQSIRKRSFSGTQDTRFVQLFFPQNKMTMMVREEDLTGSVRRPIRKNKAQEVLDHISKWNETVSDQWKIRASAMQTKLDDGDPFAIAEVYKTLRLRQQADSLSAADRRQLSQSEERLSQELAMALGKSADQALQKMEDSALG